MKVRKCETIDAAILTVFAANDSVANITIDGGATGNFILKGVAEFLGLKIEKATQRAVQADGHSPLHVVGEVHDSFTRSKVTFEFDGLVVTNLDCDILGGTPFQKANGIMTDFINEVIFITKPGIKCSFPFTKKQTASIGAITRLISVKKATTLYPDDSLSIKVDEDLNSNQTFIIEPRVENDAYWPTPQEVTAVGKTIKLVNRSKYPVSLKKNSLIQARQTIEVDPMEIQSTLPHEKELTSAKPLEYTCDIASISFDQGNQLSKEGVAIAKDIIKKHSKVFGNDIPGYNGAMGTFEASFEFSSKERPIIGKYQLPLYNKKHADVFQEKCDLEHARGRVQTLSELGEQPALVNNAFLVLKQSAVETGKTLQNCSVKDVRLVCSFNELGKYIKKMPAKVTTEAEIWARTARFKLMGETDLTDAFSQMTMKKDRRRYLCFLTPHKGIMCYTSGPQGLLGMSEYLDNLTDLVLGDLIMENVCLKIHDQLFVGGQEEKTLLHNWDLVLSRLGKCDLRLKPSKTNIVIQEAVIYGKVWRLGTLTPSPHKLTPLSYVNKPETVGQLRSFLGGSKIHSECLEGIGHHLAKLTPLSTNDKKTTDIIVWTEETSNAFQETQKILRSPKTITIPKPHQQKYIIPDATTKSPAFGAILIVNKKDSDSDEDNFKIGGYFNMKLKEGLLPCEAEALGIDKASEHWDHYSRESVDPTIILSDSEACVKSFRRMSNGKFSASSKLQNFLQKLGGRYVKLHHVSAKMSSKLIAAADFQSRNYVPCDENQKLKCPYCRFANNMDDTLLFTAQARALTLEDTINDQSKIPFQSKQGWRNIQNECKDIKRTVSYMKTNTRPGVRETRIKDVKRYLQQDLVVDNDGLLVAKKQYELEPRPRHLIVIPRAFSRSFIRLLHDETDHPLASQTLAKFNKRFYALDAKMLVDSVLDNCDLCNSLKVMAKFKHTYSNQTKPTKPGTHAAADVLVREGQKIMVLREVLTSHTSTKLLEDQKHEELKNALVCLSLQYKVEDDIVIRLDNAPGFLPLKDDPLLEEYKIRLDFGEPKNQNHNPVAEKAIQELEKVLVKLLPNGGIVSEIVLAKATETLNKLIRHSGFNSQELLTNRDQSTGAKVDLPDAKLSDLQWKMRLDSHESSSKYKSRNAKDQDLPDVAEGDIVFLKSELSKHKAREKYFIVKQCENDKILIQKITRDQIRARQYLVKIEEVMKIRKDEETKSKDVTENEDSIDPTSNANLEPPEEFEFEDITKSKQPRRSPRIENSRQCPLDTCKYCEDNGFTGIHHITSKCWRQKRIKPASINIEDSSDDGPNSDSEDLIAFSTGEDSELIELSETTDEESELDLDSFDPLTPSTSREVELPVVPVDVSETSSSNSSEAFAPVGPEDVSETNLSDSTEAGPPASQETNDAAEDPDNPVENSFADDEDSEDNLEEGDVFEIRDTVLQHPPTCPDQNHFDYEAPPNQGSSNRRERLHAVPMPGRPVDVRRPAIRERTIDIPGRLVTEGEVITYFSGLLNAENQQIWLTARVEKMAKTQQRKYPNHYNILNENGEKMSLSLLPGGSWAVRRNDEWERS